MLKFLIYLVAIWFFFRVIRRFFSIWLLSKTQTNSFPTGKQAKKTIKDIEEADYVEIKEPKS
jgi:hypothetical protein